MAKLNKALLNQQVLSSELKTPLENWDALPERVLQFGTGVLLRGLPDYFIDKANRKGIFNGRVVVVKSTSKGGVDGFIEQDGLFTIHNKGIQKGIEVQETIIVSAISRVLSSAEQWEGVLDLVIQPQLEIVISNTTEVGIVLDETDTLSASPPASFPGKLAAVLYKRFSYFRGDASKGLVILPTELISENGVKLKEIIIKLAEIHQLGADFIHWIETANYFCNTLVDRIVPGKLSLDQQSQAEAEWGYVDELSIMVEPFRLWAIESAEDRVASVLSFAEVDAGVVIAPDIEKFKELKLRLLNGSHTFSCGLAILCGFETVREAMQNETFSTYLRSLMRDEIVPAIIGKTIGQEEAFDFAENVMDRFSNPFLNHKWVSISFNYTSKMQMRNVVSLKTFVEKHRSVPHHMALGFAAYIRFMKSEKNADGEYIGTVGSTHYVINDPDAALFSQWWNAYSSKELVEHVLKSEALWHENLDEFRGLSDSVLHYLQLLSNNEGLKVVKQLNDSMR